jgi:histidyl-tRNA synthetase
MADHLLRRLRVKGTELLINSVGCPVCRPPYHSRLRKEAERESERLCPDCQRKIALNPLRIFDCKMESCRAVAEQLPKITDHLCRECSAHFQAFRACLGLYGIAYRVEPRLVRGLDYYTKTTFEIISSKLGAQDAILGGGRYDDMMKVFGGPDICGIGFAMGMERFLSVVPDEASRDRFLYLAYLGDEAKKKSMQLAREFRKADVECLVEYRERGLKNQMSRANKLGASWVLIIGEEELRKECYPLKDMASGKQQNLALDEIMAAVRKAG